MNRLISRILLVLIGVVMPLVSGAYCVPPLRWGMPLFGEPHSVDEMSNDVGYWRYVNGHEKELECLALKVFKYFRSNEKVDKELIDLAKEMIQEYEQLHNLRREYRGTTLAFPDDVTRAEIGSPCMSEAETEKLLKGYFRLDSGVQCLIKDCGGPIHLVYNYDYVNEIETDKKFNSMDCAPLLNVDIKRSIERIIEICRDAQKYCEADKQ